MENRTRGAAEEKVQAFSFNIAFSSMNVTQNSIVIRKVKSNSRVPNHCWVSHIRTELLESQNAFE